MRVFNARLWKGYRLVLLISVVLLHSTAVEGSEIAELAGRIVSMKLVRGDKQSHSEWPAESVLLVSSHVEIRSETAISRLLETNNIQPDSEAYTLIYDLNPTLEKLDGLAPGTSIYLPKVVGGQEFQKAVANGFRVRLTVDPQIKAELKQHATAISELNIGIGKLGRDRFANPKKREETIAFVRDLAYWFTHISTRYEQHRGRPLRQITLLQIVAEAELLRLILTSTVAPKGKLNAHDQLQIAAIHKDMKEAIRKWDEVMNSGLPPGETQFKVVVNIRGADTSETSTLRIYYVFDGLFRDPPTTPPARGFHVLGSGASALLPIKEYKVWASRDGDPGHALTPFTYLKVTRPSSGDTIFLDLSMRSKENDR